ncbi:MAG: SCO1664 family protein [Anaerolineales bacterium]
MTLPPAAPKHIQQVGGDAPRERFVQLLERGRVVEEHGRVRWSSNHTVLVTVSDDECITHAIYKPQRGERPLWDFPDGTLCYRERAAFLVSDYLGWHIVPPTLLRDGPRGLGSLQLFVEHNPNITYFDLDEGFADQLRQMAAFDYITNNADRKGGHCLLDENGKLWGIDHGICFHVASKLRTVIWDFAGMPIAPAMRTDIDRLCQMITDEQSPQTQTLGKLLSPRELDALRGRVDKLLASGLFPEPGYGPNYPWPPV